MGCPRCQSKVVPLLKEAIAVLAVEMEGLGWLKWTGIARIIKSGVVLVVAQNNYSHR